MENLKKKPWLSGAVVLLVLGASCVQASFEAAADAAADAQDPGAIGGAGDAGQAGLGAEVGMTCPAPNLACSGGSTTGTCDPVCQIGGCDWCNHNQKCTYAFDGTVAQAVCARSGQSVFPQACQITSSGSLQQSDDCAPGSICLAPTIGDAFTYCFALCRSKAECLYGAECGQRKLSPAGGLVGVCDPPYDQCGVDGTCCDPLAGSGCDANRFCLLVSPDLETANSRTVCDFAYGDGRNSSSCSLSRDCLLRNTCVNNACRQVCNSTNPCPNGGICMPLGTEYGYCPN